MRLSLYLERVAKPASSTLDHPDVLDTGERGCSLRISAPVAAVGVASERKRSQAMRRLLLAFVLLGLVVIFGLLTMPSVPAAQEGTPAGEAASVTLET